MTTPTMTAMPVEVDPPAIERYPYGLLSAARIVTEPDQRWEAHGVVYAADSCGPGGGVWPNPCHRLPPGPATVYRVGVNKPAGVDALYVWLDASAYGPTVPVTVTIAGTDYTLYPYERQGPIPVAASTTVTIAAAIDAHEDYPACSTSTDLAVPTTEESASTSLSCVATIPAQAEQTKAIADGLTRVDGSSFIVYEGVSCVSLTENEGVDRARNRLALHEQHWVEREVDVGLLRVDVTVLAEGSAVPLSRGVGLLEDAIAEQYGGVGTLHAARELAAPLTMRTLVRRDGARLRSPLDNLWAFGSGYSTDSPAGAAAPAGQAWLYATGPVVVRRSAVQTREAFDQRRNARIALAERSYSVTADCLRAAVLVQLPED